MRNFSFFPVAVAFLFFRLTGYSQDDLFQARLDSIQKANTEVNFKKLVPNHAVKFSPLHLLGFYSTFQVAYETKFNHRTTIQLDAGYSFSKNFNPEFRNMRGTKLKLEGRYYLEQYFPINSINYISLEPYTTIINFDREETRRECFDLNCQLQYTRRYKYLIKYRESGISLKYGYLKKHGNFLIDFNFGLTFRVVKYIKPDFGGVSRFGFFDGESFFDIPNEQNRRVGMPIFGLRFGYLLR